jgi:hypothetical protein
MIMENPFGMKVTRQECKASFQLLIWISFWTKLCHNKDTSRMRIL